MNEGKLYELQPDNTYSLYQVKYNTHKDVKEGIYPNDLKPIEKKLMSKGLKMKKWTRQRKKTRGLIKSHFGEIKNALWEHSVFDLD